VFATAQGYPSPQAAPTAIEIARVENGAVRVAAMGDDAMAKTLFEQAAPIARHQSELALRAHVTDYWAHLSRLEREGKLSESELSQRLDDLDAWIHGRLSGANVLYLVMLAEKDYPHWIMLMPRLLALRYEELRVARLWSSLLNPMALSRLRQATQMERMFGTANAEDN